MEFDILFTVPLTMQSYTRRYNIPNRLKKRPKTLSRSQVKTSVYDSIMIPKRLNPKESALVYIHNIFPVAFCDICHCPLCLASGLHPNPKTCFCYSSSPSICGPSFLLSGLAWWQWQEKTTRERERNVFRVTLLKCSICFCFTCTENPISLLFYSTYFFRRRERQKKAYFLDFVCAFLFLCRKPENSETSKL